LLTYRLYRLDGAGQIDGAEWLEASDDAEACRMASERHPSGKYELWEGRRLVSCADGTVRSS
jgi:hypothetical protein